MPASPLIPRRVLFADPTHVQPQISPDGQLLSWLAPREGVLNLWVAPLDDLGAARALTRATRRPIQWQGWAPDGTHLMIADDVDGDENWRISLVNRYDGTIRMVTPERGTAAHVHACSNDRPDTILVAVNDRDPRWHDIWSVDLASGTRSMVFENLDGYSGSIFDHTLTLRLLARQRPDQGGSTIFRVEAGRIEPMFDIPHDDALATGIIGFNRAGTHFFTVSSIGRDKAALVRTDALTGERQVLADHGLADINAVLFDPRSNEPEAACAAHLRQEWIAIGPDAAADLEDLSQRLGDEDFVIVSQSDDDMRWIVMAFGPRQPARFFLLDRPRNAFELLFEARPALKDYVLSPMRSHVVRSRDGRDLVSYLTLPSGTDGLEPDEPLPMVLLVHGGPWGRDSYGFNGMHQWLANRGYAVLSTNYRASTGFGKAFINDGDREHAGRMHDDLVDAVAWAVEAGIARADKVAIMGASYGGYATLVGLTFTPETFCCGVSIVGISNLVTLLETIPPYWAPFAEEMYRRYNDVRTDEGRAWLWSRSPLSRVDRIVRPLLLGHGENDVRCKVAESDQIAAAMRAGGLPVTFVAYPDEGHGFARPENRLSFNAITERFLAEHLGGRAEPVGEDFAGSSHRLR